MTSSMPIARRMRIDTRLRECTSASRRRVGPPNCPPSFSGRQVCSMPPSLTTTGASRMTLAGVKPCSSAAEYRNGLNPEPGWRLAWVTRLKVLLK